MICRLQSYVTLYLCCSPSYLRSFVQWERQEDKWNEGTFVIQHHSSESELRKSDKLPVVLLWHIGNDLIKPLLSCLVSSSRLLSWQTNPVTVGNKFKTETQIKDAWIFTSPERAEMRNVFTRRGKGMRSTCFLTCFVGGCCTTTSTTCQCDSSGSARAQLWHYLRMVEKGENSR